jgi:hypothetical protein
MGSAAALYAPRCETRLVAFANFDGLNLRLTLDPMERTAAHRKEFVVPRANLASVTHARDIWECVQPRLASVMGINYPGLVLIGTASTRRCTDFCLLSRRGPGLAIELRDHQYDRILLSVSDADAWPLFARLRDVTGTAVDQR